MTLSVFLISLLIFLDNIGYSVYEFKENNNKFGGICIIIISLIMLVGVNISINMFD